MSGTHDPQGGEIEVSPEELRFLRRFVRGQVLPWFLALLVAFGLGASRLDGGDASGLEARTAAALAQVRHENQQLRAELAALRETLKARPAAHPGADELERRLEDARSSVRMIESRVSASLERRIAAVEAGLAQAPAAAPGAAGPLADAAAWDVSAILDRLYALEMQGGGGDASAVEALERRLVRLEAAAQGVPLPAAPDPAY